MGKCCYVLGTIFCIFTFIMKLLPSSVLIVHEETEAEGDELTRPRSQS